MSSAPTPPIRQCVILAGGLGTRLGDLAGSSPKPLALVGGRPFLDYVLSRLRRLAYTKVLLLAGHRSSHVTEYARSRSAADFAIDVSVEPSPLGTAGALRYAADLLDARFLMLNGDSLFQFNWRQLEVVGAKHEAAMALRWVDEASRYGVVTLNGCNVERFEPAGRAEGGLINGGVYTLSRHIAFGAPERGSLEGSVFPELAVRGVLAGKRFDGFFIDIGVPNDFSRAQTLVPAAEMQDAIFVLALAPASAYGWDAIEAAAVAVLAANHDSRLAFLITSQASTGDDAALRTSLEVGGGYFDDAFMVADAASLLPDRRTSILAAAAQARGWGVNGAGVEVVEIFL